MHQIDENDKIFSILLVFSSSTLILTFVYNILSKSNQLDMGVLKSGAKTISRLWAAAQYLLKAPPVHYWDLIANIHPQVNNNNKYIFWQHSTWENSADSCVGGINAESTTFLTATDPLTLPGAFCWVAISYFIQEFWPCWICSYFYFWACTIIPWYMLFRTSKHCAPLTIMTQYRNSFFKQSLILDIWNMTTQIYHTLQWFMFHKPMVSSELRLCLLQFCRHTITINNALIWVAATWKEISDTIFSLNTLGSSQKRHQGSPNWSSKRSPCMYST